MSRPIILVVDDDPLITNMLTMVLDLSLDAEIFTTNSSVEAQEILRQRRVSLLLTDFLMPNLNGIHLIRTMREEGITIPVVLLTGYCDEPELAANPDFLQPFEVILKPWNNENLIRRIKAHLNR